MTVAGGAGTADGAGAGLSGRSGGFGGRGGGSYILADASQTLDLPGLRSGNGEVDIVLVTDVPEPGSVSLIGAAVIGTCSAVVERGLRKACASGGGEFP